MEVVVVVGLVVVVVVEYLGLCQGTTNENPNSLHRRDCHVLPSQKLKSELEPNGDGRRLTSVKGSPYVRSSSREVVLVVVSVIVRVVVLVVVMVVEVEVVEQ